MSAFEEVEVITNLGIVLWLEVLYGDEELDRNVGGVRAEVKLEGGGGMPSGDGGEGQPGLCLNLGKVEALDGYGGIGCERPGTNQDGFAGGGLDGRAYRGLDGNRRWGGGVGVGIGLTATAWLALVWGACTWRVRSVWPMAC